MVAIEELFSLYLYFTHVTKLNSDMAYLLLLCYNYLGRFLNLAECFECEKKTVNTSFCPKVAWWLISAANPCKREQKPSKSEE